jgi:hypothetical protein
MEVSFVFIPRRQLLHGNVHTVKEFDETFKECEHEKFREILGKAVLYQKRVLGVPPGLFVAAMKCGEAIFE